MHHTLDGWLGLSGVGWLTGCPEPAIRKLIPVTTAQRTGQSRVAVTQPLSPSHKARPPLTNATRSIEPPKSSSWSEGGDDAAALQLQQPLSRRPQPLQSAHSQRASDEPPVAPASQSSSASYASPRLPFGPYSTWRGQGVRCTFAKNKMHMGGPCPYTVLKSGGLSGLGHKKSPKYAGHVLSLPRRQILKSLKRCHCWEAERSKVLKPSD